MVRILLLEALVRRHQEQYDQALIPMERCLELAEPEGYARMFLDEGHLAADLLRRTRARGLHRDYCDHLGELFESSRSHEAAFGVPEGGYCPQVLVSVLFDVCAKIPIDVEVSRFASSERDHLFSMLPSVERGDILVLDRGYPSHEVLQTLAQEGVDFLIRLPSSHTFSAIDDLRESDGDDYRFHVDPQVGSPPEWTRLTLRAVRMRNPDGAESFFFTTLPRSLFSRAQLRELYHMRWEAEEFYKLLKSSYIGQGQFRSKTPTGIRQEINALVLFLAIARILMASAADASGETYESLSQKSAVLGLAAYITRLFLSADMEFINTELQALFRRIVRARDKRRKRRSCPRRSFRPRLRWGPTGRCGD